MSVPLRLSGSVLRILLHLGPNFAPGFAMLVRSYAVDQDMVDLPCIGMSKAHLHNVLVLI